MDQTADEYEHTQTHTPSSECNDDDSNMRVKCKRVSALIFLVCIIFSCLLVAVMVRAFLCRNVRLMPSNRLNAGKQLDETDVRNVQKVSALNFLKRI